MWCHVTGFAKENSTDWIYFWTNMAKAYSKNRNIDVESREMTFVHEIDEKRENATKSRCLNNSKNNMIRWILFPNNLVYLYKSTEGISRKKAQENSCKKIAALIGIQY